MKVAEKQIFLVTVVLVVLMLHSSVLDAVASDTREPGMKKPDSKQLLSNVKGIPTLLEKGVIGVSDIPNPHWRTDRCHGCHKGSPTRSSRKLKDRDVDRLCSRCHEAVLPHSYIHPHGMKVGNAMKKRMPGGFNTSLKRSKGKLSCITCHDLTMTCAKSKRHNKLQNPAFLRQGPYHSRTDLCFQCHNSRQYERLNPHDQITKRGKIKENTCKVCHRSPQLLADAKSPEQVDFHASENLSDMCTGCHEWKPHPGGAVSMVGGKGPNHLVKPSRSVRERMEKVIKANNVILPLDSKNGRVYCGTCHNPHEKGVIKQLAASKGADAKNRLRLKKMCRACHEK